MNRTFVALLVVLLLVPATAAAAPEPPARKSANVAWLASLEEPSVVSARFKGTKMFVSTLKGLAVYDVADPALPKRVGFLALPHFENEDVDMSVGRDFVLISNDPSEGSGRLYVVSVADPTAPAIVGEMDTGLPLPGFPAIGPIGGGTGHTASCVLDCRYAYLAGTASGIDIVDLTDPTKPKYATPANFPAPEATGGLATHDVQFDAAGHALITGAGGTAIYDVTLPLRPRLLAATDESGKSDYAEDLGADGSTLNDLVHHNSHRLPNGSLLAPPAGAPEGGDSSVMVITEEDYQRPTCAGAGSLETWRIGSDGVIRNLDRWDVEIDPARTSLCSAHYFDEDGGLISQGWYEQGTRFLDVSDPADIREVGYWIPQKNVTWGAVFSPTDPTGQIVYSLDHPRGIDVLKIARGARGTRLPPSGSPPPDDSGEPAPNLSEIRPPTSGGPSGGGGTAPGGGPLLSPSVGVRLADGRRRARRGTVLRYSITVRNTGGVPARDVRATVRLPRALAYVRGGRKAKGSRVVAFRTTRLAAGASRTFVLRARVRRTAARRISLRARVSAPGDASTRDDTATDRTTIARSRGTARGSVLARRTAAMETVGPPPPPGAGDVVRQAFVSVYGLCRRLIG